MKLPVATEWALHCATSLAQLEAGTTASAADLAEYFDLPAAYLAKQLQALTRAGVLTATTGPRGGFRLGRAPADITLLQIVEAVDWIWEHLCNESMAHECILAVKMAEAHQAWRASLDDVTLADILADIPAAAPARTRKLLGRRGT